MKRSRHGDDRRRAWLLPAALLAACTSQAAAGRLLPSSDAWRELPVTMAGTRPPGAPPAIKRHRCPVPRRQRHVLQLAHHRGRE